MRTMPQIAKYVLNLSIALFTLLGFSQKELKNKIVDFTTLAPIESASIYIQNTTIGTVSNVDGKFALLVPKEFESDSLIISSIGYKSFKTPIEEFDSSAEIYLEEDIAALDEILLIAESRPETGNEIVLRALEKLPNNMPESPFMLKGFLRHKERNTKEFKWLIESAITVYDSSYPSYAEENLKINVDEVRKSYDLRDVDSLLTYAAYLKNNSRKSNLGKRNLRRDTIATSTLVDAIKWNDNRVNGLENLLKGKLNLLRNSGESKALFDESILERHDFELDTVLVDDGRKIYKIHIKKGSDYINLDTPGIFNGGYVAEGWLYIYWDNFAVKKIEYNLVADSDAQKRRSKDLFGTQVNHKLILTYIEFEDKMYPNYIYYETPKLVNVGLKPTDRATDDEEERFNREERYYYTVQEILFTDIIFEEEVIDDALNSPWDSDIFKIRPYHPKFWKNYNTLLESDEDEQLIQDLTKRSSLYKQ
ncbi:CarboxypepD_reg-like domain-containing protein [Flavobacteriaceae bacterium MAR_2010_188]|nr:CarboxypepD_reg-like domain-containing protein [Flavobacteriaceae bacterium MAR_2010_188]